MTAISKSPAEICGNANPDPTISTPFFLGLMRTNQRATSAAESRFPVRIRIGIPPGGLGRRLDQMDAWLDANCDADGWAITPSGSRGVVNDALAIYFADATLASAFVARWCVGGKVETVDGVFQVRDDEPTPRVGAGLHRTP
jgi:hypothetical protein